MPGKSKRPVTVEGLREELLGLAAEVDRIRRTVEAMPGAAGDTGGELVARVAELGAAVESLGGRVNDQVGELVGSIADAVSGEEFAELAREVEGLAELVREGGSGKQADGPPPVAWVDVPADQAGPMLADLEKWMTEVLVHYPLSHRLTVCWYRHADLVQELLDLRAAWVMAYRHKGGKVLWALDWHQRHLPHVTETAREVLHNCSARSHRPPYLDTWPIGDQVAAEYVAWWTGPRHSAEPERPGDERRRS